MYIYLNRGSTRGGCVWVGQTSSNVEQFTLLTYDTDPQTKREYVFAMLDSLTVALASRLPVVIEHETTSGIVRNVGLGY